MQKIPQDETRFIHSPYQAPAGFAALPVAIHHASTVIFSDVAAMRARSWLDKSSYTYGLHGTPTSFTLEARLAEIEGGKHCLLAPSGLAAISLLDLALLKTGDDVLLPENVYGPNRDLAQWLNQQFGISARCYDPLIGAGIAELIRPETRLIWTEAPGSVTMEVPDIPAICAAAHARGVLVALDNTWAAGLAFAAFEHGVDIVMQALTKYQSGGSDVLMGALITRDAELYQRLQLAHMRLGYGIGMDDAYLVLRNLSSLKLRLEAHDRSARLVAQWLAQRTEISRVLHPALPDCPGHAIWQRDFSAAGGLFSVIFDARYTEAQTDRFVDSLRLFKIGFSWGGAHSLCLPYRVASMRSDWQEPGTLVRFNIGLEHTADLLADIEQALQCMVSGA
ncbi:MULTISPECIES: cystathionine beta-lyase [unclassified Undibacterium]|uniref:cystathionine beta-lyase n=1 Tax=unclassified Undibacterium TaxID=2630295 RepID=UPI002AC9B8E0|nr:MULTISPECIES: cystathionine beta-lyase [unclassified Undibacterium]MEB0140319.1 cystathionine beta-lyase [Undibacterium sp. CCC2.1]MEB0173558.1 cystathionine beta-lyase [Undibacterium sp. CCC1.1]MEB0177227.1 cystathionine beta-lyase [Undibacterium sp. CCC3.4]MEB0216492.1 cystathionine beta-lyase [Undibacterium sp. 5I2]WPX43262.1 cystathionine beta-lyase [Undibacterium sp. CCC3.4]